MHAECKMNLTVDCKPATAVLMYFASEEKKISYCTNDLGQERGLFYRVCRTQECAENLLNAFGH